MNVTRRIVLTRHGQVHARCAGGAAGSGSVAGAPRPQVELDFLRTGTAEFTALLAQHLPPSG
jgi:hypothetical protein